MKNMTMRIKIFFLLILAVLISSTSAMAIWQHGDIDPPKFLVMDPVLHPLESKYHFAQDGDVFVVRPGEELNFWVAVEDICPTESRHDHTTPWAYPYNADITAEGVPPGATLESLISAYKAFYWNPTVADIGTYDITFTATFSYPEFPNSCEQEKVGLYSAVDSIIVKVVVSETHPKASAGKDKGTGYPNTWPSRIYEEELVTLYGGASNPEGVPLAYTWEQIFGVPVTLNDPGDGSATFTAPHIVFDESIIPKKPCRPWMSFYCPCEYTYRLFTDCPIYLWWWEDIQYFQTLVFQLTVSDGVRTSTDRLYVMVRNIIDPPVITSPGDGQTFTVTAGDLLEIPVTAIDPGTEEVTLFAQWASDGEWPFDRATFSQTPGDPAQGLFSWATDESDIGSFTITFKAVDESHISDEIDVTIIVEGPPNLPPVITAPEKVEIIPEPGAGLLTFPVTATDPDNDIVDLAAETLPGSAMFSSTSGIPAEGMFSWETEVADLGTYEVVLTATDEHGLSSSKTVTIEVKPTEVVFLEPEHGDHFPVREGQEVRVNARAMTSGDAVTIYNTLHPSGSRFEGGEPGNPSSGTFYWTPPMGYSGGSNIKYETVKFEAIDEDYARTCNLCDEAFDYTTVQIEVVPCEPPYFTAPTQRNFVKTAGEPIDFDIEARDDDGPSVTVTSGPMPGGFPPADFTGNPAQGTFHWETTEDDVGSYSIEFTATDSDGLLSAIPVTITVMPSGEIVFTEPKNREFMGEEESIIAFHVEAFGPRTVSNIQLSMQVPPGMPSALRFEQTVIGNPATGIFGGEPETGSAGVYTVTFTATAISASGPTPEPASITVILKVKPNPLFIDSDGDGIPDELDLNAILSSKEFSDEPTGGMTFGEISDRGDQTLTLSDLSGSRGIWISSDVSGGSRPAVLKSCGNFLLFNIPAGTDMVLECGSAAVEVITGTVKITFFASNGAIATLELSEINSLAFDPWASAISAPLTNSETIFVFVDGEEYLIPPGETLSLPELPVEVDSSIFPISETKLTASDAVAGDRFGGSVGISGDTAIVGRGYAGGQFAYVFSYDGSNWVEEAKLTASDAAAGDYFGDSVGISGDTAIVGAWGDDDAGDRSGSAYVFSYDGANWVEEAKLTASDAAAHDCFGKSVAIDGDTILVGATGTDLDTMNASGSVYVFQRSGTTLTQEAKLTASDAAASDEFGCSVAIDGDTILVGAWGNDDECPSNIYCNSGSAYVFRRSGTTWTQEAKLTASDAAQHDMFGRSVVITGDTVAVAAMSEGFYVRPGSVYVFQRSGTTWTQEAKLTASDHEPWDGFGHATAISGDTVTVCAWGTNDNSGSVYVFRRSGTTWTQEANLTASDAAQHDYLGVSIAMGEDTMVVGAHRTDDACPGDMHCDSGSAYVYILAAETPTGDCVVAQPVDTKTGTYPVTLTFSEVTQAGTTSLVTSNTGPSPPSGFQLGNPPIYYDLTTTAISESSGWVRVCIDYSGISFSSEEDLKLFHYENGEWVDVTLFVDTTNKKICGIVHSLSPFAIFEPSEVEIEARYLKEGAINALTDYAGESKQIEKAIKEIEKSLDPALWETDSTLTEEGKKVFDQEKKAVKQLMKIVKKKSADQDVKNAALEGIGHLITADRALASTAIEMAIEMAKDAGCSVEGNDDPECKKTLKEIAKAEREMDKAQKKYDKGKHDKAIDHYKKAWKHAQKAMNILS